VIQEYKNSQKID